MHILQLLLESGLLLLLFRIVLSAHCHRDIGVQVESVIELIGQLLSVRLEHFRCRSFTCTIRVRLDLLASEHLHILHVDQMLSAADLHLLHHPRTR